jgi:hypothetical protein
MLAGSERKKIAFTVVIGLAADAIGEGRLVVEQESFVAIDIHQKGQVACDCDPRRFAPGSIEQPERRIQRRREQRAWPPFEARVFAIAGFDGGAAGAGQHVKDFVIEMTHQIGAGPRRDVDHLQGDEIAAAAQVNEGGLASSAEPRPGSRLHLVEIDGDGLDNGNALLLRPVKVAIDEIAQLGVVGCHYSRSFIPNGSAA